MMRWTDGVGRTIIIAGIAGALFAGFLALTPRLTASNSSSVTPTTAVTSTTSASALPGISDPVVAVPSTAGDFDVTVTTEAPSTTVPTTTATDPATTTSTLVDAPHDGTISLVVEARGPRDAKEEGIFVEGDQIQWRFLVTNESDQELWGTYVYLELHGPALCDEHNLEPGDSTDCWIVTTAVEGTHTAEAWATAWTLEHQVAADVRYTFTVSR